MHTTQMISMLASQVLTLLLLGLAKCHMDSTSRGGLVAEIDESGTLTGEASGHCYLGSRALCMELQRRIQGHHDAAERPTKDAGVDGRHSIILRRALPRSLAERSMDSPREREVVDEPLATTEKWLNSPQHRTLRTGISSRRTLVSSSPPTSSQGASTSSSSIRILPVYQLPSDMAPAASLVVQRVVSAAIQTIQGYIQVRFGHTIGSSSHLQVSGGGPYLPTSPPTVSH
jgi:hypothetical protein